MRHITILEYRHYRYLKIATALQALAILAYAIHSPSVGPYGGTWLGYTLGTVGALLILWLLWFGVRKRRYLDASGTLQGWLSGHVYLGASLLVIVTLHTGFEFGWNLHTLAYVLMVLVIVSGFYGVYAYLRYPRLLTDNIGEETLPDLLQKISDMDGQARTLAMRQPDEINVLVLRASQETRIGGSVMQQLSGKQKNCPTAFAVEKVQVLGKKFNGDQGRVNRELCAVLLRKKSLVEQARKDVWIKARIDIWLYVHVPLSISLLVALTAHVVSVFFYW